ncbi:MAG TPA: universal stress protein [Bryobacteraceae bacterium]|nr:universal stress protein [Bryobacteraceae bacterium]
MFKHILLPTDGSPLSDIAIEKGIQLARSLHAKVTGLCVVPKIYPSYYDGEIPGGITEQAEEQLRTDAKVHLAALTRVARAAGVECEVVVETSDQPFEAILMTAEEKGCDLIMMASHGRRGVAGILLGSETQKVLTHCKIPVLVFR